MNTHEKSLCALRWNFPVVDLKNCKFKTCCQTPFIEPKKDELLAFNFSSYLKDRRREMQNGIQHHDCSACWTKEKYGLTSLRQQQGSFVEFAKRQGLTEVIIDSPQLPSLDRPEILEIVLDNTCDLACIYCGPEASSRWQKELFSDNKKGHRSPSWDVSFADEFKRSFWSWVHNKRMVIEDISLIGGEPLLAKNFYDTLSRLEHVFGPVAKDKNYLGLTLVSNLNASEKVFSKFLKHAAKLSNLFSIKVSASTEACGGRAEYIRFGLSWKNFVRNTEALLNSGIENLVFSFQTTINALSISSLTSLIEFAIDLETKFNHSVHLKFNVVNSNPHLSPRILTEDFKFYLDQAMGLLHKKNRVDLKKSKQNNWETFAKHLKNLRDQLPAQPSEPHLQAARKMFYNYIKDHDLKRKTTFEKTFPEYKDFLSLCKETLRAP